MTTLVLPGLRAEDDLLHPISEVRGWTENYLSHASFPEAGASHWLHLGRAPWDRTQWQEIFAFFLPGDRYLVAKSNARPPDEGMAAGAALAYECLEPFSRWRKTYRGGARLVTGEQLRSGPLTDGREVGVEMELEWTARGPAFTMDTSAQTWTDAHYEQFCDVAGRISWGDETLELAGAGLRDHSWGPRDYAPIGRHCWILAQWDDGRSFMIFHLISRDGAHTLSHVTVNGEPARFTGEPPLIGSLDEGLLGYTLELETEDGTPVRISAEVEQAATLCMLPPAELGIGACPDASHWLSEAQSRFTWDGATAHGLTERTVLL